MKRLTFIIILIIFSCKSSRNFNKKKYKNPIEFVEQLQLKNYLGDNPLVYLEGKEIGFYEIVKEDSAFVNAWFQYEAYITKKSKFADSLIGKKALDGIVMIDRSHSYHESSGQVAKIVLADGNLITRDSFSKIKNEQIKSILMMFEIELVKDKFYEIVVVNLKENIKTE